MGLLEGKHALIFGVANKNSIAWGVAQALHREGATVAFSYANEKLARRVVPLAESIGSEFVQMCDVTDDDQLDQLFVDYQAQYGKLDTLIHSVAFAPKEELDGRFHEVSRAGFHLTLDISAYSLLAMTQRARPLMTDGGSIAAMTFYAAEKVIPRYNAMAIAKAALELSVHYLAADLGHDGIRVNGISAGAIKTLSGSGISGFREMLARAKQASPLNELVSIDDVGNAVAFLASDWGRFITGEILHVDAGFNIMGYSQNDDAQ